MPETIVTVTAGMPTTVTVTGGVADVTVDVQRGIPGPNSITTATTTPLVGFLSGNGATVTASTSATFVSGSTATFNSNSSVNFISDSTANFNDNCFASFNSGSEASFYNNSIAAFVSGSTAAFGSGSTAAFASGSEANFVSGTIKLNGTSFNTSLNFVDPTSDKTITLPDATGTVALDNDPRFTDARTPTAHTHPSNQITLTNSDRIMGRSAIGGFADTAVEIQVTNGLEFSGSGQTIQRSALTGDITATAGSNATTLAATIAGAKELSGQLELTGQAATTANSAMTRVLADKNIMFNVAKVRILPTANMQYNTTGAGASASNSIDGISLTGSVTASAFTRAALTRTWTNFSGSTGANNLCSVPVAFAFFGMFNLQATNTVIRFIVGDAGSGAPALPSANAISGRGFGFEIFFDSVPKIRLFAHDGTTYTTSAAVNSGTSFNQATSLLIASDGAGNLKLFFANSGSIVQRIPETATITHTGAPTSGAYTAAFASILTANNTTAPLLQQALVRIPQVIIHSNQVY